MPYIPKEHQSYPVLPYCRERGGEVFQYRGEWMEELRERIGEKPIPYGYDSYEEYDAELDRLERAHGDDPKAVRLIEACLIWIKTLNP